MMQVLKTLQHFDKLIKEISTCEMANTMNVNNKLKIIQALGDLSVSE